MKKILINITAILCLSLVITSCDKIFDSLEGDLTKLTSETMVNSEAGIMRLLAQVYSYIPVVAYPNTANFATSANEDFFTMNAVDSHGGDYGFNNAAYYGNNGIATFWNWTAIRSINSFISAIPLAVEKGTISESKGKEFTAEARFVRAYCYFVMVRGYGGVPIITEVLDKYYDGVGNEQLLAFTPRATEKETWDFVISELDAAIADLPDTRTSTPFRATKWAAYGLQSRVALYAASVSKYWTNAGTLANTLKAVATKKTYMESSYAAAYYAKCIAASEAIIANTSFYLYGKDPASISAAVTNLGTMFTTKQNSEYIFGITLNNGVTTSGSNWDVFNSPQQTVTGSSACGRYSVTLDLVDLFDNYDASRNAIDGTVVTRNDGIETSYMSAPVINFASQHSGIDYKRYSSITEPFLSKDARFQAWILYPNSTFRGKTIKIQGGLIKTSGAASFWAPESESYGGNTYYAYGDLNANVSGYYNYTNANLGNTYTTGFGLRKFLDPTAFQLYIKNFWYDIRYAEILLNYCEAVVESGTSAKYTLAAQYLNDIRHRAAFTDNVALNIGNVLHQRRLELAFERDGLYTLHRRREFYNENTDPAVEGRRHSLTPVLDLTDLPGGGTPKYIFVRSIFWQEDIAGGGVSPSFSVDYRSYYKSMPDYGVNGYEPNPINE
jgi:starch-binding outer membrane protein, SusD/RagB family